MYRKQVRRRRAVLVVLVVTALILISTFFTESNGGPLHSLQRGISAVLGPIEEGASRALKPARDLINWFDETFDARGDNEALREELAEARADLAEAQGAVGENRQLRKLLGLDRAIELSSFEPLATRVIGRSPTVWYSSVTIDKGSSAGVAVDDPVIGGDGLVGRVRDVTRGNAQVLLITDHRSAVSAKVLPDGPEGVVEAEVGDPDDLLLDFIEGNTRVREGEILVTAGWSGGRVASVFPFGIPIGRVVESTVGEQATFQRVHVRPFADIRDLNFLQVLTRPKGGGE